VIPQIQPWIDHEELDAITKVINSTQITEGPETKLFEDLTKELTGSQFAIAYSNGTNALFAALVAVGVGPGDEVIVPNLTFIASANAVIMCGATPVFSDVDKDTFNLSLETLLPCVTEKTRAVIPVHLYGQAVDMDPIMQFCANKGIFVVEDGAQGVGVRYKNRHVGSIGNIGILSYYGNKTITCGEGGMVLTNDIELANKVYAFKNHGRMKKGVFTHDTIGFNFAFTEMQAAIGVAQMGKLARILKKKKQILDYYRQALDGVSEITWPTIAPETTTYVPWFSSIQVEDPATLSHHLSRHEIGSRRFFLPLHLQPCYQGRFEFKNDFKNSMHGYNTSLSLPSSYGITIGELEAVAKGVKAFFN
jgi:perosamine synthetase